MTVTAFLLDDEALARRRVRQLIEAEADFRIVGESDNPQQAIDDIRRLRPDVIFVDVQMPGTTGIEVAERLSSEDPPLFVFVTAYEDYALKAFDVQAFDYLLKPFDRERFQKTLERVRVRMVETRRGAVSDKIDNLLDQLQNRRTDPDRIAIRTGGHVVFIRTQNIDWVEAADNYVCLHCGGETHVLRETMNSLEQRLDPARFYRIHRSTIVNADRIKELQPWFRGDYIVLLQDGAKLMMSRTYREKLQGTLLRTL